MSASADDPADPSSTPRGPGGAHPDGPRLSQDIVVDAAVELVREHGLDSLRMKTLATALDVTPMALYWYVGSKAELVELVVDRVVDPIAGAATTGDFGASVRALTDALYDGLRGYPGVAFEIYATQRYPVSLGTLIEKGMQVGVDAGFAPPRAALQVNLLAFFTIVRAGVAAAADLAERTGAGTPRDLAVERMSDILTELPSGPLFAEYVTYLLGTDLDEIFHQGIDILVAGMLAELDGGTGDDDN